MYCSPQLTNGHYGKLNKIKPNQAIVLDESTPADVARAMIERGHQKEPFFIFNIDNVYRRIEHWRKLLPRVHIFYAMKANDHEWILKLIIAMGAGFDCASPGEIDKVLRLNIPPESVIYAVPNKTREQMIYAREAGVRHTTFDTKYELEKLKLYWPDARLLIRIKVESMSIYRLSDKFGCDPETEATDLLDEASRLGLNVVGVAFHVGSACSSNDSHMNGIRYAHGLFQSEAKKGRHLHILDIGGGFLSDKDERIDEAAKLINKTLEELFPDTSVQIVAEPGRYLCDSAMTLYCSISNVKRVSTPEKTFTVYYINEGIYGTLRCPEPWHTVKKFMKTGATESTELEDVILYGPTCDSTDLVLANMQVRLPRCTPQDWLVLDIQGAYTLTFQSVFSSMTLPPIRLVVSKSNWMKLKSLPGMNPNDFITAVDISEPLPLTYKSSFIQNIKQTHSHTHKLHL